MTLTETDFLPLTYSANAAEGSVAWEAPSNIALIKYWGKREPQLPANPSVSFTLSHAATTTRLSYKKLFQPAPHFSFEVIFEGIRQPAFEPKIAAFFQRIERYLPFLKAYHFTIETANTFPHSSGIASSASALGALALCLMSLEQQLCPGIAEAFFYKKASFIARLGSGSACRSLAGGVVAWGRYPLWAGSSDLYAIPYPEKFHEVFTDYQDTILLVDTGAKPVSSSAGHQLMQGHPFASARLEQAAQNIARLHEALRSGNLAEFISVVETEALSLHALMMTSQPYFLLMQPNTLRIIQKIWEFRDATGLHPCFTLDAGANVHLLYPKAEKEAILAFIKDTLSAYCENQSYICDEVGDGAETWVL